MDILVCMKQVIDDSVPLDPADRKSTRLNSSHHGIGVGGVWV